MGAFRKDKGKRSATEEPATLVEYAIPEHRTPWIVVEDVTRNVSTPSFRIGLWFLGVVAASLLPFTFEIGQLIDTRTSLDLEGVLGDGELLLISIAIAVAGVLELAISHKSIKAGAGPTAITFSAVALFDIIVGVSWWSGIRANVLAFENGDRGTPLDRTGIAWNSIGYFVIAVMISCLCVSLTEGG